MTWLRYIKGGQVLFHPAEVETWDGEVFIPKNGISLADVPEKYVPLALSKVGYCCGNEGKKMFSVATPEEIAQWNKT